MELNSRFENIFVFDLAERFEEEEALLNSLLRDTRDPSDRKMDLRSTKHS